MASIRFLIETIWRNEFRCNYLKNKKTFPNFFPHFWNLVEIWNIFKKKLTLIADVFTKFFTPKDMVKSMPKKFHFGASVEKQYGKCTQTLLKFEGHFVYHIFWSMQRELSYKKFLLVICKISRLFPNTLTADGKYSLLDRDNLTQRIQMELSQKQKTFPNFLPHFWNVVEIWNIFKKKLTLIADVFPKVWTPKNMVRSMP